jgi:hypothetical protein
MSTDAELGAIVVKRNANGVAQQQIEVAFHELTCGPGPTSIEALGHCVIESMRHWATFVPPSYC